MGRDHWHPIQHRFREIRPRVGLGNRHAVVVVAVGDERPAIVLALLDQVQFVATARAVLYLAQFDAPPGPGLTANPRFVANQLPSGSRSVTALAYV